MISSVGPFYMQSRKAGYHKRGMLSRAENRAVAIQKAMTWLKENEDISKFLKKYIRAVARRSIR